MNILDNYKYTYGSPIDTSDMILIEESSWYQIFSKDEEPNGKLECPICGLKYDKHNGKQSDCRRCTIIVTDNENSGIMYITRAQKKRLMKAKIDKQIPWKEPTRCRTSPEIEAKKIEYMKKNKLGVYNKNCIQHSKENISKMLKAASHPDVRKKVEKTKRENKTGQYNPESIEKSIKTRRENGQIKKVLDIGRKTQSSYWLKDDNGNYLDNSENAVKFRKNHYIPTYSLFKNRIEEAWENYRNGKASEKELQYCENILKNSFSKEAWEKYNDNKTAVEEKEKLKTYFMIFDRDSYYDLELNICSFEVNGVSESDMKLSDFINKYDSVGSVKAYELVDKNNNVIETLDVVKTNGTIKELSWFYRTMKKAKEQRNLSEEELSKLSDPNIRLKRRKYLLEQEKYTGSKIRVKIIYCYDHTVESGSEEEKVLLDIEVQYAHDSKALFWNP